MNLIVSSALLAQVAPLSDKKSADVAGTSMIGNSKWFLTKDKIYGWGGAKAFVKEDIAQIVYRGSDYSGVVHDYIDNAHWNGGAQSLKGYKKIHFYIKVLEGSASDIAIELNSVEHKSFGQLKGGKNEFVDNVIDLTELANDEFTKMDVLEKLQIKHKPGQGKYQIRISIE
jgi:hypothetical protein